MCHKVPGVYLMQNFINVTAYIDTFSISISSPMMNNKLIADEGSTVNFTAVVNSKYKSNFAYQWQKKGRRRLPNKISSLIRSVLIIPVVLKSDEGKYYCNVTNEWGRTVISKDITLSVKGMYVIYN